MIDTDEKIDARTVEEDMETRNNMNWLNNRVVELEAEVKSWRDSYIDLWNICIELYDGDIELHRFKDWLDERSGGDLYPMKHEGESE
tara:strand:+ start:943 stop:1203 length:261 start_codon:yes stop_codon:yes gene_type:complete